MPEGPTKKKLIKILCIEFMIAKPYESHLKILSVGSARYSINIFHLKEKEARPFKKLQLSTYNTNYRNFQIR